MKNVNFEKINNKLTKEEMNVLKGGLAECERTNTYTETRIVQGSTVIYQDDIVAGGAKNDS